MNSDPIPHAVTAAPTHLHPIYTNRINKDPEVRWAEVRRIDYTCPICLVRDPNRPVVGNKANGWVIDHDHTTGQVRGLLCAPCNRSLHHTVELIDPATGRAELLRRMVAYVEHHAHNEVESTAEIVKPGHRLTGWPIITTVHPEDENGQHRPGVTHWCQHASHTPLNPVYVIDLLRNDLDPDIKP